MKIIDKYLTLKRKYKNNILLIRSGNFYYTYFEDALILNYLCNYQVINERVGFPKSTVNKIIEVLKFSDIDFVIYDNEVSEYKNKINNYNDIKFKAKENYDSTVKIEDLLKTIRYKIDYSYDNYTLIKEIY